MVLARQHFSKDSFILAAYSDAAPALPFMGQGLASLARSRTGPVYKTGLYRRPEGDTMSIILLTWQECCIVRQLATVDEAPTRR